MNKNRKHFNLQLFAGGTSITRDGAESLMVGEINSNLPKSGIATLIYTNSYILSADIIFDIPFPTDNISVTANPIFRENTKYGFTPQIISMTRTGFSVRIIDGNAGMIKSDIGIISWVAVCGG